MSKSITVCTHIHILPTPIKKPRVLALSIACATVTLLSTAHAATTPWVRVGQSGRILYGMDSTGDRIMDFSQTGYMTGSVPLPNYTTLGFTPDRIVTVNPLASGVDNLASINAAIALVAAKPLQANGFRGVVQLSAGAFNISNTININTSGIIFRGVGDSTNTATSTILKYTGTAQIDMIHVDSNYSRTTSNTHNMTEKVVPAGATSFAVDSVAGYAVGDTVVIHRPSTANWIHDLGMDAIVPRSDGTTVQWTANSKNQDYERVITHIDATNKRIQLDAPLADSFSQMAAPHNYGGGTISKASSNVARTNNVGIENIRGDGQAVLTTPTDEAHANSFIVIQDSQNAWVNNVTGEHLVYATTVVGTGSKYVTVNDAASVNPISQITGGRRYPFDIEGQFSLVENTTSDGGRHEWVNNSPSRGPNVFLNGTATNGHADAGPHQRWSTGTLYDNLTSSTDINVQNRGNYGTGHGWAGADMVIWNSKATDFYVQNPPTDQNWLIGSTGTIHSTSQNAAGSFPAYTSADNAGSVVTLTVNGTNYTSLYLAQLAQRTSHATEQLREYVVGDYDTFVNDGATDTVPVDATWKAQCQTLTNRTATPFDVTTGSNISVPFTFNYDVNTKTEVVTAALLTFSLGTLAADAGDKLYIENTTNFISLSSLTPQQFANAGTLTSNIYQIEFLSSNPNEPLSFLQDGKLNLMLNGNRTIDWANLQYFVAPVPEPTSLAILSSATLTLATRRRRDRNPAWKGARSHSRS